MHSKILILDFGSQVTQLIARRVREAGVFCEIFPYDVTDAFIEGYGKEQMGSPDAGKHPVDALRGRDRPHSRVWLCAGSRTGAHRFTQRY